MSQWAISHGGLRWTGTATTAPEAWAAAADQLHAVAPTLPPGEKTILAITGQGGATVTLTGVPDRAPIVKDAVTRVAELALDGILIAVTPPRRSLGGRPKGGTDRIAQARNEARKILAREPDITVTELTTRLGVARETARKIREEIRQEGTTR